MKSGPVAPILKRVLPLLSFSPLSSCGTALDGHGGKEHPNMHQHIDERR